MESRPRPWVLEIAACNKKSPADFVTAGPIQWLSRSPVTGIENPEHSLDEERPLSTARQVSWLPAYRLSRAFPSCEDSGISGRLTVHSGASAADSNRFPFSHPLDGRAGLVGLDFRPMLPTRHGVVNFQCLRASGLPWGPLSLSGSVPSLGGLAARETVIPAKAGIQCPATCSRVVGSWTSGFPLSRE